MSQLYGRSFALLLLLSLLVVGIQSESFDDTDDPEYYQRTFIVVGPTGAGKSTMINSLMFKNTKTIDGRGTPTGLSTDSVTNKISVIKSPMMSFSRLSHPEAIDTMYLQLIDTVGVDAADKDAVSIFNDLATYLRTKNVNPNGFILVHKMERYRKGTGNSLKKLLKLFKKFNFSFDKVILVITHSSQYTDEIQDAFTDQLCKRFGWFTKCREQALHLNFVNYTEIRDQFKQSFLSLWKTDRARMLDKMVDFDESFVMLSPSELEVRADEL